MVRNLVAMAAADVAKARKAATVIIEWIEGKKMFGYSVTHEVNMLSSRQGLIVVIGPTSDLKEAVLCEIGIGKSRPYGKLQHIRLTDGSETSVNIRQTRFQMTLEQYRDAAPLIFVAMGQVASERTGKWKYTTWTVEKMPQARVGGSGRKTTYFEQDYEMIKGIRFSVAVGCAVLIADLLWSENRSLRDYYTGLGQHIDMRLAPYRQNGYHRQFRTLQGAQDLMGVVGSRAFLAPAYRRFEALGYLPGGDKNPLYTEIAMDILRCDFGKVPPEIQAMKSGLPEPESRVPAEIYCRGITTLSEAKEGSKTRREVSWHS
ncbi:MAG: hypothetical protein M1586_00790 [Patescibacteria group bacterium]|nr:hypothetical protein [Patescibacteria group bacterium]